MFAAYADAKAKARWFVGPDEWEKSNLKLDFRVGGRESVSGGPPGGPVHSYDALYQDIVPNERIVLTYEMHLDKTRISVSLGTTEFKPAGQGTRLVYTEQAVYLDGHRRCRRPRARHARPVRQSRGGAQGSKRRDVHDRPSTAPSGWSARYKATPARVFAAWAEPEARAKWDVPGRWMIAEQTFDFREGGREREALRSPGRSAPRRRHALPRHRAASAASCSAIR